VGNITSETDSPASRKNDEANGLNAGKRGFALVVHPFWLFCSLFGLLVEKRRSSSP
jgi:hypothetical protein